MVLGRGVDLETCGTTKAMPHSLQRTRWPRTLSGTRRIARQPSRGQSNVTAMMDPDPENLRTEVAERSLERYRRGSART